MGDFSSLKRATLALDLQTARPKMELLSCSVQISGGASQSKRAIFCLTKVVSGNTLILHDSKLLEST